MSEYDEVIHRLDELRASGELLRTQMTQSVITQVETRADLQRVEAIATASLAQSTRTNGRVTALELWKAELKGITQGAGGTGRLLVYILTSAAAGGSVLTATLLFLDRVAKN